MTETSPLPVIERGAYRARLTTDPQDISRAQALRFACFQGGSGLDQDRFDPMCQHVMIEDAAGSLLGCCRVHLHRSGADVVGGYAAQFYDLTQLAAHSGVALELGRFCVLPKLRDPHVLRMGWAMLVAIADKAQARYLFGCASFAGTDWTAYRAAFEMLAADHQAPNQLAPQVKAKEVVPYVRLAQPGVDRRAALAQMPSLLRSYLSMGGWVSDHAVIDRDLGTLHVLTGVEVAAIPAARARSLRALIAPDGT